MTAEVEDICKTLNWEYQVFDTQKSKLGPGTTAEKYAPHDVKGINFRPKESETGFLTFFARYKFILDKVASALANVKLSPGESPESLADRIEDIIKRKFGDEDVT